MPSENIDTATAVIGVVVCAVLGVTIGLSANRLMPRARGRAHVRNDSGSGPSNAHGWWDCSAQAARCDDGYRSINGSSCQAAHTSLRNQVR